MQTPEAPDAVAPLTPRARMLVATAFLAIVASSVSWATFEYMVIPIQTEQGLSVDQINAISRVAEGASLVVVFIAGTLGDRLGRRLVVVAGAAAFCAGAALVSLAPGTIALAAGRGVGGIGASLMTVTALAVVKEEFVDDAQRARVFGLYAAATPAVFLVAPPLAALLVERVSWRAVPVLWVVLGLATLALALWRVPAGGGTGARGGLLAPLLAGVGLAAFALGVAAATHGSAAALLPMAVCLVALLSAYLLTRRRPDSGLDLRLLRDRRVWPVAGATFLATGANLASYGALYLQYRYPESLVQSALLLVLPQLAAVAGSILGGQIAARWGPRRSATLLLLAGGLASLCCLLVRADSPPWVVVLVLVVAGLPLGASVAPLTQAFMDLAPSDGAGGAASIRNALGNLRGTLTGVASGAIIFAGFQASLSSRLVELGAQADVAERLAQQVRSGAVLVDIADGPLVSSPALRDALIGGAQALHAAQATALGLAGVVTAVTYVVAAGLMALTLRPRRA